MFALFLLSLLLPLLLLQQSSHVRRPFPVIYYSFFHLIPRFWCQTLWGVACAILIDERHRVKWNTSSSSHVWRPTLLSAPAHTWTDTSCRSVGDAPPLCKSIIIIFKIKDLTTICFFCFLFCFARYEMKYSAKLLSLPIKKNMEKFDIRILMALLQPRRLKSLFPHFKPPICPSWVQLLIYFIFLTIILCLRRTSQVYESQLKMFLSFFFFIMHAYENAEILIKNTNQIHYNWTLFFFCWKRKLFRLLFLLNNSINSLFSNKNIFFSTIFSIHLYLTHICNNHTQIRSTVCF